MLFLLFGHDPSAEAARLTINQVAARKLFEGAGRALIAVTEGQVRFKPLFDDGTSEEVPDSGVVQLEPRARGGAELAFVGNAAEWLSPLITGVLRPTSDRPYYLFKKNDGGWWRVEPFGGDGEPPRSEPHLRVWRVARPTVDLGRMDDSYPDAIRQAARLLREAGRRVGRPSREVVAAQQLMAEFEALVREVVPHLLLPSVDVAAMRSAADALLSLAAYAEQSQDGR